MVLNSCRQGTTSKALHPSTLGLGQTRTMGWGPSQYPASWEASTKLNNWAADSNLILRLPLLYASSEECRERFLYMRNDDPAQWWPCRRLPMTRRIQLKTSNLALNPFLAKVFIFWASLSGCWPLAWTCDNQFHFSLLSRLFRARGKN